MIATADIARMTLAERLQAMELLWQSLSVAPAHVESPDWHGDVLAERLARVEAGEARFLSLEEAKARLNRG